MKKVLSFVLILALVLGSFSFAFGLSDVDTDNANSDAIEVANNLGIVQGYEDGKFLPEKTVNRAEFATMITRALGVPESALAGFTATTFKDTSGYGWAVKYLAFCDSKGIILGDGMGNAMPGRTISLNEAVTMVLRAVGYTTNSKVLVGEWPSNYVTLAQDKGLYKDVAAMMTVDRGNAAQVLYNALTLSKVQVDADGFTQYLDVSMLTGGLKSSMVNNGEAFVLGTTAANTAVINAQKYIGAYVEAYANNDGDIIAIKELSTFLTGKKVEGKNEFKADGKVFNMAAANIEYVDVDGTVDPMTKTKTSPAAFVNAVEQTAATRVVPTATAVTIAVDLSGKTIKSVYSISSWVAEDAFKFEASQLEAKALNGHKFTLDANDAIDKAKFRLLGAASLEDIAVDDVVTVYKTTGPAVATATIVLVKVGNEKVTGKVTKISSDKTEYTIDGKVYELTGTKPADLELGVSGTAFLDYDGDIAFFDLDDASKGNYAMFEAAEKTTSFAVASVKVKLFSKEGTEITPTLKNDVGNITTATALALSTSVSAVKVTEGAIVEYSLDSDGKVNKLNATTHITLTGKVSKDGTLIGTTPIHPGVVVFLLNTDNDFEIGSVADFGTDTDFSTVDYTVAMKDGKIRAIAVEKADIVKGSYSYGVINATGSAVDGDDNVLSLEGFMDGVAFDKATKEADSAAGAVTTGTTGLVRFEVGADGVINEYVSGTAITSKDFVSTAAVSITAVSVKELTVTSGSISTLTKYVASDDVVVYLYNTTEKEWEISSVSSSLVGKSATFYVTDTTKGGKFNIILAW